MICVGNIMGDYRRESEEEALFRSYPYALYLVQSPSTISHANTNTNTNINDHFPSLSPYSSRASNTSLHFNHTNKYTSHTLHHKNDQDYSREEEEEEEEEEEINGYYDEKKNDQAGWIKLFSLSYSSSGWWILMQLSWRFLLSFIIALLVFYVAAKPPPPTFSVQVAGIPRYRLGEGVDASGVTTKILSCNVSIDVIIDNHSKLFALHIHPPIMQLSFGRLTFATSSHEGREVYAGSDDLTLVRFHVGTKNKAMYGAGRSMQDFLESGNGLPLILKLRLRSRFNVIWGIVQPKYHHQAQCLMVLTNNYDTKHRTQVYNSTCVNNYS